MQENLPRVHTFNWGCRCGKTRYLGHTKQCSTPLGDNDTSALRLGEACAPHSWPCQTIFSATPTRKLAQGGSKRKEEGSGQLPVFLGAHSATSHLKCRAKSSLQIYDQKNLTVLNCLNYSSGSRQIPGAVYHSYVAYTIDQLNGGEKESGELETAVLCMKSLWGKTNVTANIIQRVASSRKVNIPDPYQLKNALIGPKDDIQEAGQLEPYWKLIWMGPDCFCCKYKSLHLVLGSVFLHSWH